ncbi:ParB/RepB/Spo0J family partition protein [Hallerella succinigenes]|nr:ParB/RepB/Spo0J family partition protein [Hallerella succinigenes]MBS7392058.1 ParB/RepB/Spo0J family partition protein [Fibrobacter sp.]MDD6091099.1 ParB/RepB/Spo0J family partition protein [Hallerella succinigenes]MDY5030057.1 ParB/RepB/Spo0J family partition protein [Hallerella succinigenes]
MGKKSMALGQGLSTIMQSHAQTLNDQLNQDENGNTIQVKKINLDLIDPNPYQPRTEFNEEELVELAETIEQQGLIQPITVRKFNGRYQIVSGERRTRAARLAGWTTIDAYVHELLSDKKMAEWSLIENIQRVDLNAIEVAKSYEKLIENYGYTHDDLAKSVGKSRSAVTNALRLLKLPEQVQAWISEGKISQSAARTLLSPEISDPEAVARDIIEKGMNVREIEQISKDKKKEKAPKDPAVETPLDPNIVSFLKKMEEFFGTSVKLQKGSENASKGKLIIDYYSFEDLTRIQEKMEGLN